MPFLIGYNKICHVRDLTVKEEVVPPLPRRGKHFLQLKQESNTDIATDETPDPLLDLMHHNEESCNLYVSNLDKTVNETQLREIFKDCPGLKEVRQLFDLI